MAKPAPRKGVPTKKAGTRPPATGSHLKRGSAVLEEAARSAEESERKRKQSNTWRFWLPRDAASDPKTELPKNQIGLIILDESIDDPKGTGLQTGVGFYEHTVKVGPKRFENVSCPAEWANCAICESGDNHYYIVMLSVYVLRPWSSKDGKRSGEGSKMLLPIKAGQLKKFQDIQRIALEKHGTMRGVYIYMERDMNNPKGANIGEPVMLDSGSLFDFYTEEELEDFAEDAVVGKDGKVLRPAGDNIQPYDYEEMFPMPDADEIRRRFSGGALAGSDSEADDEWGTEEQQAPRAAARRPARGKVAPAAGDGDEEPDGADPFEGEED